MTPISPTVFPFRRSEHPNGIAARTAAAAGDGPATASPTSLAESSRSSSIGDECRKPTRWRVAAWITPHSIPRLAEALGPTADVVPCASLEALTSVVREGAAAAVIEGVDLTTREIEKLAELITWHPTTLFPGIVVPPMGSTGTLVDWVYLSVVVAADHFARGGVRAICRSADDGDWEAVARSLAAARLADPVQRACVAAVLGEVWGDRIGLLRRDETALLRFFSAAFDARVETVADVAAQLEIDAAVLAAWFVRRGLPGADRYVAAARLVRAGWTRQPPSASTLPLAAWHPPSEQPARIHRAARRLRRLAALSVGGAAAHRKAGTAMLNSYRVAFMNPFRGALRTFDPAGGTDL